MGTNRLESFSDGVIAVAITLLVLGLTVPTTTLANRHGLLHELGRHWPSYAAYVISFITIGIIWMNHHAMINRLQSVDHAILMLNLLLLLTIGVLPFATDLMATFLRDPQGRSVAAAVYAGALLAMSITFAALNRHILLRKAHLMGAEMPVSERRLTLVRSVAGLIPYVLAVGLAFVSSYVTLAICGLVAAYYALPLASSGSAGRAPATPGDQPPVSTP